MTAGTNVSPTPSTRPAGTVPLAAVRIATPCLTESMQFFVEQLGFRHHLITPADAPRRVELRGYGVAVELIHAETARPAHLVLPVDTRAKRPIDAPEALASPDGTIVEFRSPQADSGSGAVMPGLAAEMGVPAAASELHVALRSGDGAGVGRAAMEYRDLLPNRWGGRFIVSHITIPDGGDVPDWVHYHRIRLQLIYVMSGWVDVVYEDQGPPFRMHAGDCVLQPPTIRHRVLRASPGLEVIEIGCPAEHDTLAEHEIELPTAQLRPERRFGGQLFRRHIAADATIEPIRFTNDRAPNGWGVRPCGIDVATDGLAGVRVAHAVPGGDTLELVASEDAEFVTAIIVDGAIDLVGTTQSGSVSNEGEQLTLTAGEAIFLPPQATAQLRPAPSGDGAQVLLIDLLAGALRLASASPPVDTTEHRDCQDRP